MRVTVDAASWRDAGRGGRRHADLASVMAELQASNARAEHARRPSSR